MEFPLGPLSTKQTQAKNSVIEAYESFWNNIKFRKGWESPIFSKDQVSSLLERAADIVVRIRSYLDSKNPSFKLRMTDGSAREYLWSLQHGEGNIEDITQNPDNFVREIVHNTFKDANGYVEGLSPELIDEFIRKVSNTDKEPKISSISNLKKLWSQSESLMKEFLGLYSISPYENEVTHIISALEKLNREVELVLRAEKDSDMEVITEKEDAPVPSSEQPPQSPLESQFEENRLATIESSSEAPKANTTEKTEPQAELEVMKDPKVEEPSSETESVPQSPSENQNMSESSPIPESPKETPMEVQNSSSQQEISMDSQESQQKSETSESSEKPTKGRNVLKDSGILKIQVVAGDVDNLKPEIKSLQDAADKLQFEKLAQHPIEARKTIEELQHKCVKYTEGLMKDLLTLDGIVASQESRPLRKAQVTTIQNMIDDVDTIQKKLRTLSESLKQEEEKLKEEQKSIPGKTVEEPKAEESPKASQPKPKSPQYNPKRKSEEIPKPNWKLLKLKPKFEVSETPSHYSIACYIPGMNEKDINISLGKNQRTITIEGLREPTDHEDSTLRSQLRKRYGDPVTENQLILKAGAGRFGKFSETYQLPDYVDTDGINANYERGILNVTIPKIRRHQRNPFGFPTSFANDQDFWW